MLRKKGHQVAKESQHTQGTAVDFRIQGVPTEKLLNYVRSLRLGRRRVLPAHPFRPHRYRPHPVLERGPSVSLADGQRLTSEMI